MLKHRRGPRVPIRLRLLELGPHLVKLRSQHGVLSAGMADCLLQLTDVLDCCNAVSGTNCADPDAGITSGQRLPFTRFVVLAGGKSQPQSLKTVLHLAAALSLRQLMRHPQLRCPTIRRTAAGRIGVSNETVHLLLLQ